MPGVWRLGAGTFALISIREEEGSVVWRQQEYSPALVIRPGEPMLAMRTVSVSEEEIVFESSGESGHARVKQLRMIFSRSAEGPLRIRFLVPAGGDAWLLVRNELHHRFGEQPAP